MRHLAALFSFLLALPVGAGVKCLDVHSSAWIMSGLAHPVEQLFLWEETANTRRWAKPTVGTTILSADVPNNLVHIRHLGELGSLRETFFSQAGTVTWPHHPWNKDASVPFVDQARSQGWAIRFSASRSLFFHSDNGDLYSLKAPTNDPHNNPDHVQMGKADLSKSVQISYQRSLHVQQVDQQVGIDSHFQVLLDTLTVSAVSGGNGFVIRDLRPLQDGFYYLPAFSIPYVGFGIARRNGRDFRDLWGDSWAGDLGRSKAKFLLRYSLQMKTPNAQNMLIQLDGNLRPTGKMFFRDIGDSSYVEFVAKGLGFEPELSFDKVNKIQTTQELIPNWDNSAWQMDEGGIPVAVLNQWRDVHDVAYVREIVQTLSQTRSGRMIFRDWQDPAVLWNMVDTQGGQAVIAKLAERLKGRLGQLALRESREQLQRSRR